MPRGVSISDEAELQKRLWSPAIIRPALWLDANDLSTISVATGISQWRDKSGNGRHVSQATGGTQPTFTRNGLNGLPVLSFNGSQYLTSISATSVWNFLHNTNGSSVFAVWKAGNVANPNTLYGLLGTTAVASANIGLALIYDDRLSSSRNDRVICTIERGVGGGSTATNLSLDNAHPSNTPVILSHIGDPNNATAANRSFIRVNNGAVIQLNTSLLSPSASNASFTLQIGACGNNQIPMVGYIAEIVVFNSIVNDRVRQQVEGYLANKWGLRNSLVASHPFLNRPPLIGD
jgi:hypothetical protein